MNRIEQIRAGIRVCKNCGEVILPCKPWGWHHGDGPVQCGDNRENLAEPADDITELLSAVDTLRGEIEEAEKLIGEAMGDYDMEGMDSRDTGSRYMRMAAFLARERNR
jgi:hypothetical protein